MTHTKTGLWCCALLSCSTGCVTEVPEDEAVWVRPETEIATYDPTGEPTSGEELSAQIWGLDPSRPAPTVPWEAVAEIAGAGEQDPQDPQESEDERRRREALIRTQFGDAVVIGADGRVTKQYFLSGESGNVFLTLISPFDVAGAAPGERKPPDPRTKYGGEELETILGSMLGSNNQIEVVFIPQFENIQNMPLPATPRARPDPAPGVQNSLLLVTAKPSALTAFEQALNLFYANFPQVEIAVKVVEYSTVDALSFGVTTVDVTTPTLQNLSTSQLVQSITSGFPLTSIDGTSISDRGLIQLGGIHDSWELNAVLQLLETNNIADVQSQPKMVVRNGGMATITTVTQQPFPKAKIVNQTTVATDIEFKDVGVIMHIRPEIAGTDTVILLVHASVSAITGFVSTTDPPTPIIATREATTSLHLRDGQTTVIGGLISQSTFELESKVPIIGDIPILGYLFRSTTTQKSKTTLEFHITPRILTGQARGDRPAGALR